MAGPNLFSDLVPATPQEAKPQPNMFADIVPDTVAKQKEEEEQRYGSRVDFAKDFARSALQGLTLGHSDEAIGKVRSMIEGRPYEETRNEEREALKRFHEQYGPGATATEVGGGLATPLGGLAKAFQGATLLGKAAKAVPFGYGVGAVSGVGASESEKPSDWLKAAHESGTTAAMIAPIVPVAGAVAGTVLRRGSTAAQNLADHEAAARLYLADKLRSAGLSEKQIGDELARGQAATKFAGGEAALPETIADVTPTTQRTLRGIKVGGEADNTIEPFLGQRQAGSIDFTKGADAGGQHGRLAEDMRLSLKLTQQELADKLTSLTGKRSAEADKMFGAARTNSEPFDLSRTLEAYNLRAMDMPDPAQRAVLQRAVSFFDQGGTTGARGGNFPVDNVKRFHEAKQALDDLINRAEVKEQGNLRRQLTGLKHDLMDEVFVPGSDGKPTINAGYRAALDKFASRSELLNAADLGAGFARGTEQVTPKMFRNLSEGEKAMFRAGWQHVTTRGMGGKAAGPTSDFTGELRKPNTAEELRMILPPQAGRSAEFPGGNREKLGELVKREQRMSGTATKVLGNSSTAEKAVDAIDIGRVARVLRYVRDTPGGVFSAAASSLSDALEKMSAIKGPRAQYLAKQLLETDPAKQQAFLKQVEQTYGGNVARRINEVFNRWLLQFEASIGGAAGRGAQEQRAE